jgi:hypothetical protein
MGAWGECTKAPMGQGGFGADASQHVNAKRNWRRGMALAPAYAQHASDTSGKIPWQS